MRKYIYIILLFILSIDLSAQRYAPMYSQYWVNGLAINPAYAGSRECFSNIILYRNQWMGFDGAPETQTLSSHAPLKDEKNAVGVMLYHEAIGVSDFIDIYGNYAFRFRVLEGKLSLGLRAGITLSQSNWNKIETDIDGDDVFNNSSLERAFMPNAGFGAYYYTDKFYLGLSIPSFLSYRESTSGSGYEMYNDVKNYDFILSSGILVGKSDIVKFKPSILFRYRLNNSYQFDVGGNFILYNVLWVGGSYRYNDELALMIEYQINDQIRVGGAYDFSIGDLSDQNDGSMEVILRYEFKYKIRAVSPRYF